jgi:hypothetical protein
MSFEELANRGYSEKICSGSRTALTTKTIARERSQTFFGFPFDSRQENAIKRLGFSNSKWKIYFRDDLVEMAASLWTLELL